MQRATFTAGILIAVVALCFASADYVLKERPTAEQITEQTTDTPLPVIPTASSGIGAASASLTATTSASSIPETLSSSSASSETFSEPMSSSSAPRVVKKGTSTKKKGGVNVTDIIAELGLAVQQTNEASFLALATQQGLNVQTSVLLWHDDRAFLLSWLENDNVKTIFGNAKQTLQEQFSGNVTDLVDETRTPENGPTVNILSFFDPALSAERIIFLRVRTRLYEIHVAKNGEGTVNELVKELSK